MEKKKIEKELLEIFIVERKIIFSRFKMRLIKTQESCHEAERGREGGGVENEINNHLHTSLPITKHKDLWKRDMFHEI